MSPQEPYKEYCNNFKKGFTKFLFTKCASTLNTCPEVEGLVRELREHTLPF